MIFDLDDSIICFIFFITYTKPAILGSDRQQFFFVEGEKPGKEEN